MRIPPKADLRRPEYRREVFQRFYAFHLRHRSHPGGVYYLMPYLADQLGWDAEERMWYAFLNGNTQHPVTSLLLFNASHGRPAGSARMLEFYQDNYERLAFDTDRRHHKKNLPAAVGSYRALIGDAPQADRWAWAASHGWDQVWEEATRIVSFGRLSAWSYIEYLRIMGVDTDAASLLLGDRDGSRSHRNGLCIVTGRDAWDWHASNPAFDGRYPPDLLDELAFEGERLLAEARHRGADEPYAGDITRLTLESALCTYKSWHRPNRRYPNVYNDMLYDRLRRAEEAWPDQDLTIFWEARAASLPPYLRLEDRPYDPGVAPVKQNWYRTTGETVMMGHEDPELWSGFDRAVEAQQFPRRTR